MRRTPVGFGICAALVALLSACGGGSHPSAGNSQSPSAAASPSSTATLEPTPSAPKVGFNPESFSAVSPDEWWVLSSNPCFHKACPLIAHTTDAGRTFHRLRLPASVLQKTHLLPTLRFADSRDGFLFGTRLFSTHDAGKTWHPVHIGANVRLAIADGYAYAVAGSFSHNRLWRSAVGTDRWSRVTTPKGYALGSLWAQGSGLFLYGANQSIAGKTGGGRLLESTNGGATWVIEHLPIEDLACSMDVVALPVVWTQCATGMLSGIWRSVDDGRTFTHASTREGAPAVPNSAVFAAASNDTAVVASFGMRRTTDAGAHWQAVGPKARQNVQWDYLGFTDAEHGAAIRADNSHAPTTFALWLTSDAGAHWHQVAIPS